MNAKIVLFCSYGSAQSNRVESDEGYEHPPSPLWVSETARISLRPSNEVHLSLLFSEEEFQDTIRRGCDHGRCPNYDFEFRQTLFEWSDGHIGALSAINEIICNRVSYAICKR